MLENQAVLELTDNFLPLCRSLSKDVSLVVGNQEKLLKALVEEEAERLAMDLCVSVEDALLVVKESLAQALRKTSDVKYIGSLMRASGEVIG